jgi:hypothetical protein
VKNFGVRLGGGGWDLGVRALTCGVFDRGLRGVVLVVELVVVGLLFGVRSRVVRGD